MRRPLLPEPFRRHSSDRRRRRRRSAVFSSYFLLRPVRFNRHEYLSSGIRGLNILTRGWYSRGGSAGPDETRSARGFFSVSIFNDPPPPRGAPGYLR